MYIKRLLHFAEILIAMKKIIVRFILIIISIVVLITLIVASLFIWVNKTN